MRLRLDLTQDFLFKIRIKKRGDGFSFTSFLPSFWMGKAVTERKSVVMLLSVLVAASWILYLKRKYDRKL